MRAVSAAAILLCVLHGVGVWVGMGGWSEISNPWPLAMHDHPVHFHSSIVGPKFLRQSGTNAGYDPSFMAGYPKSLIFPQSSTLFEVVAFLSAGVKPVLVYKLTVLIATACVPWLMFFAGRIHRLPPVANLIALCLFLAYVWGDGGGAGYPLNYPRFGMTTYFVAVPWSLLTAGLLARFLSLGGWKHWLFALAASSFAFLLHVTAAMLLAPVGAILYLSAWFAARRGNRSLGWRHLGLWLIPIGVLLLNSFWWLPGYWLMATRGESGFVFVHRESVWQRFVQVALIEPNAQALLVALLVPGFLILVREHRNAAFSILGFALAGVGWGYLAGAARALDVFQPGRHTYALYAAATLAAGIALDAAAQRLSRCDRRFRLAVIFGVVLVATRYFAPDLIVKTRSRLGFRPGSTAFLRNEDPAGLEWVVSRIRRHVAPGGRVLYEEGGFSSRGVDDVFRGGRYSGLLPYLAGVEVLGGPYLHVALQTNFTQFGEGKLFGKTDWGREHFVRYARLYRPSAIVCWSPHARAFCRDNRDLIRVLEDDGVVFIGEVRGFPGATIEGSANVRAEIGRLRITPAAGQVDDRIVLRYHSVPYLKSMTPVRLESVHLEDDPAPFIAIRPDSDGEIVLELDTPP